MNIKVGDKVLSFSAPHRDIRHLPATVLYVDEERCLLFWENTPYGHDGITPSINRRGEYTTGSLTGHWWVHSTDILYKVSTRKTIKGYAKFISEVEKRNVS